MQQVVMQSVGGKLQLISLGMLKLVWGRYTVTGPAGQGDFHLLHISWNLMADSLYCQLLSSFLDPEDTESKVALETGAGSSLCHHNQ